MQPLSVPLTVASAPSAPGPWEPVSLRELMERQFPAPKPAVPGILYPGFTMLAGSPKSRKTWLSLDMAIAIATGGEFLGRRCPVGNVLLWDVEPGSSARRSQKRLRLLLDEWGYGEDTLPPDRISLQWTAPRIDEGFIGLLADYLRRHPHTRLVCIDPLQSIRPPGRDENTYAGDYRFVGALAKLAAEHDTCIVGVHHLRKMQSDDPLYEVSGTTGLIGSLDGIWILKANQQKTAATLFITGRDVEEDTEMLLSRSPFSARWTIDPSQRVNGSDERTTIRNAMANVGWPMTMREIHDAVASQFSWESLRKLVRRMRDDGEISVDPTTERHKTMRYIVTPRGGDNTTL